MNTATNKLLESVTDIKRSKDIAYNIRQNGETIERNITDYVSIVTKSDGQGIDIIVRENAPNAFVLIPVIITMSGLTDIVYNDFYIGKNAKVTIIAGCAIRNDNKEKSRHQGIHRFFVEEGAKVKYIEKHYGEGRNRHKTLDPVTEIEMKNGSSMEIDTVQIEGVDKTDRLTKGILGDNTTLVIKEKILTNKKQTAKTKFELKLNGERSSAHIVSRSVAIHDSVQEFISNVYGNDRCYAHIECDAIIKGKAKVDAIPRISANHEEANLIHEATIGKIAGEQLLKLMSIGLSESEAEAEIINGFLK